MAVGAERPPKNVCHCRTPVPSMDGRDYLVNLVQQIANENHDAFTALYQVLSPALRTIAQSRIFEPLDAAAVLSATFVEVWRMARFHTNSDTDVYAWATDIVLRRATDRWPPAAAPNRHGAVHGGNVDRGATGLSWIAAQDHHMNVTLSALLATPSGGT